MAFGKGKPKGKGGKGGRRGDKQNALFKRKKFCRFTVEHVEQIDDLIRRHAEHWRISEADVIADDEQSAGPRHSVTSGDVRSEDSTEDDGEKRLANAII